MVTLYVVRHGKVMWNQPDESKRTIRDESKWIAEAGGTPLISEGEEQAELTGKKLASVRLDAILASPMMRTVMTAAHIAKYQQKKLPIEIFPMLQEARSGGCKKFSKEEMQRVWSEIIYPDDISDTCWCGPGDAPEQAGFEYRRAENVVKYIKERFKGDENILLVSHGMFVEESLNPVLLGIRLEDKDKTHFFVSNCGISKFEFRNEGFIAVATMNETAHLGELSTDKIF